MSTRPMTEELRYDPPTPAMQAAAVVVLTVQAVMVVAFVVAYGISWCKKRRKRIEKARCTLCAAVPSPMFYTGCMFVDGHDCNGWTCDGKGSLTRVRADG